MFPPPEVIQTLFLIITSIIGWALKSTLEEHLKPIKDDIKQLRISVEKMTNVLETHRESSYPHDSFERRLDEKFVTKEHLSHMIEKIDKKKEE